MPGTGKLSQHSIRQAVDLFRRFLPDLGNQRLVGDDQVIPKNEDLPGMSLPPIESTQRTVLGIEKELCAVDGPLLLRV